METGKKKRMRSHRKTNKEMEMERTKKWKANTEAWRKQQSENNEFLKQFKSIQIEKKIRKQKNNPTKHNEWYGDKMTISETWPEKTKENTMRIYGQNVNGISHFDNYSEWKVILENLHNQQIDVACLAELNLDVTMPEVRYTMLEKAKKLDKNVNLTMAGSKTTIHGRIAKRGGVMTLTRGN